MLTRHTTITTHILAWLLALAGSLMAGACSSAADEPERSADTPGEPVGTLSLYLNMGDSFSASRSGASRTPSDGPYDPGSGYENYIDVSDIRLYAFNGTTSTAGVTTNTLYEEITDLTLHPLYDADGEIRRYYYISFPVTEEFKKHFETTDLKLVLLANWHGTYPSPTDGSTIEDLVKSTEAVMDYTTMTPTVTADNRIPLFGVKNFQNVTSGMTSGSVKWLDDINLLRALAKVEVYDDPESPVFIESAYITRYVTKLYKAPLGVDDESDYKTDHYASDYGPAPSIPTEPDNNHERLEKLEMKPLPTATPDGPRHFVIYIPEYKNIGRTSDNERIRIEIHYEGLSDAKYVDFKYYNATSYIPADKVGEYFNINRNYWYQFSIHKDREVKVQVVPYACVELRPGFGLEVGKNYVAIHDENGKIVYWYDPMTGNYYGLDKVTLIDKPNISKDPVNGWTLSRDANGQFVCYHDVANGIFYGWDRKTKIAQPTMNVDPETKWYIIKEPDPGTRIYYYYDWVNSRWYLPDKKTRIERPFENKEEIS